MLELRHAAPPWRIGHGKVEIGRVKTLLSPRIASKGLKRCRDLLLPSCSFDELARGRTDRERERKRGREREFFSFSPTGRIFFEPTTTRLSRAFGNRPWRSASRPDPSPPTLPPPPPLLSWPPSRETNGDTVAFVLR